MLQKHLLRPGTIASWHVINFAEELNNPQNVIIDFAKNMMAAMRAVGKFALLYLRLLPNILVL